MELMIKYSEFLTILIQALMITVAGFIFVGCWDEVIHDVKRTKRLKRKGGRKNMRQYVCSGCGFKAWALDNIRETTCNNCGMTVITEPVPKVRDDESFIRRVKKSGHDFVSE